MGEDVYQLKATILDIDPPIWRQLVVPAETTLASLHEVLQAAFGWWNYHLHEFEIDGVRYGIDDGEGWEPPEDERRFRLADVASQGSTFVYLYDFGDGWRHEVVVEKVFPAETGRTYPLCTGGGRARPPEDCGGPWGYQSFLAAVEDPEHEDHESMLEWVGGQFDPEAFDATDFEKNLRHQAIVSE